MGWDFKCSSAMCFFSEALGTWALATCICLDHPNASTTVSSSLLSTCFPLSEKYRSCHLATISFKPWLYQSRHYVPFKLKEPKINTPSLTLQMPEQGKHVWGFVFVLFCFSSCLTYWLGSVRAHVAATMDKHAYRKRKGKKET